MDLQERKKVLRKEYLELRKELPAGTREAVSAGIAARLFALPFFEQAETVFCYYGMPHEIDTRAILREVLRTGKRLAMPLTGGNGRMTAREVTDLSELKPGSYGIPEPSSDSPVIPKDALSLILVPGLAFDPEGFRLGHGGGYYDRYLPYTSCPSVGLCPEIFLREELPRGPHDVRIPYILTESRLIITGESS